MITSNQAKMIEEEQLNFFRQNCWLNAQFTFNKVSFIIYSVLNNIMPTHKLEAILNLKNDGSGIQAFETGGQLHSFMKNQENYEIDMSQKAILFKWILKGYKFQKQMVFKLPLKQTYMTKVDQLKCQNYLLKRRLDTFQNNQHRIIPQTIYQIVPGTKQKRKYHQKVEQDKQNLISISSGEIKQENTKSLQDMHRFDNEPKRRRSKNKDISDDKKKGRSKKSGHKTKMISKEHTIIKPRKKVIQSMNNNQQKDHNDLQDKELLVNFENQARIQQGMKHNQAAQKSQNKIMRNEENSSKQLIQQTIEVRYTKGNLKYTRIQFPRQNDKKYQQGIRKVKLLFQNGDTYFGEVIDDVYNGFGLYTGKVGSSYQGYWRNGKADGKGISIDKYGNKYKGSFILDQRQGQAVQIYSNGQKYNGYFKDDYKNGYGKYCYYNGDYYQGEWKHNMCHGKGKQVYADGTTFNGNWIEDQKNGEGILAKLNGLKYQQFYKMGELVKSELIDENQLKS